MSYAGVVNLQWVRILCHVAMLNKLELWAADVSSAYLEALTDEKVYMIAKGEHWGDLEGHTIVILKALYGLKRSGHSQTPPCAPCSFPKVPVNCQSFKFSDT